MTNLDFDNFSKEPILTEISLSKLGRIYLMEKMDDKKFIFKPCFFQLKLSYTQF